MELSLNSLILEINGYNHEFILITSSELEVMKDEINFYKNYRIIETGFGSNGRKLYEK